MSADVAACATERPRERFHHHRPQGEGAGGAAQLFISPAGQPFRARPGDPYPVAAWFAAADADHDGRLTREEMREDAAAFFRVIDANHDGVVDGAEVSAYEHQIAPEILGLVAEGGPANAGGGFGGRRGGGHGGGRRGGGSGGGSSTGGSAGGLAAPQGAARYSLINQPEPVAAADANFDGKITLTEFLEASDRHFAALDTTQAGFLTLSSLPRTPVQARGGPHRSHPNQD